MTRTQLASRGRYFEDFVPGELIKHPLGRTVLEADNTCFTLLTMNTASAHFDANFALRAGHERMLVNSGLTLAIVLGQSVVDLTQNGIFNLGWDDVRLRNPVYVGDTLYAESRILEARPSGSRPAAGIVTAQTRGLNQRGDVVITYVRTFMVHRRGSEDQPNVFPEARAAWPSPAR
jgi:acyl dehydratase